MKLNHLALGFVALAGVAAASSTCFADPIDEQPGLPPITSPSSPDAPQSDWQSPPIAIVGYVLASLGTGAAITGSYVLAQAAGHTDCEDAQAAAIGVPCSLPAQYEAYVGSALMIGGGGLLLASLPMIVIGSWGDDQPADAAPAPAAKLQFGASKIEFTGTF